MHHIVVSLLVDRFEAECGKWQTHAEDGLGHAMLVEFTLPLDYEREQGYRHLDMLVYAPMNYVQVFSRRRWSVIDNDHLEWSDEIEDEVIKKGCDYDEGATDWALWADHDSGWRSDGIGRVLRSAPELISVRVRKVPLREVFPTEEEHCAARARRAEAA